MNLPEYEYKGLMAQAWDVLRGDTSNWEDRFFYLDAIKKYGQPVLDVGCGTGRLLLDFLAQGIDADGVDNSPDMLDLLREKAEKLGLKPTIYRQFMETLELPRKYQTILIPSSSLQLIIEPANVMHAMHRFMAHLNPGGVLISPLMQLWREGDPLDSEWEKEVARPGDGITFRRLARARYNPPTETEDTEDLYLVIRDGQVIAEEQHRRSPATRSYTQAQGRELFEAAGFVNVQLFHEFTWEPVREEDTLFSVLGFKPKIN